MTTFSRPGPIFPFHSRTIIASIAGLGALNARSMRYTFSSFAFTTMDLRNSCLSNPMNLFYTLSGA